MNKRTADNQAIYLPVVYNGLMLFFMLSVSALACAENEQEIGEPVRPSSTLQPYYMVLAPTGERTYVMYHGMLVQYQLNPLKIISKVDIELDIPYLEIKDNPKSVFYHRHTSKRLFITNDEKRIIIYGHADMKLFDVKTNKVIKTISLPEGSAVMNGDEFVTFEKDNTNVTIWNANDLTMKRQFQLEGIVNTGDGFKTYGTYNAHKVGKYIFAHSGPLFRILESKNYKKIVEFYLYDPISSWPWIDYELKTLGVTFTRVVSYPKGHVGPEHLKGDIKYHLEAGRIEVDGWDSGRGPYVENIRLFTKSAIQKSPIGQYSSAEGSLFYKNKYRIKSLFQFPDGEAVLWSLKTNKFQATKNALKNLRMKNINGEIVPLNNATFNQYNQADLSHMEW